MNSYETAKGFEVEQFYDAFARYLSDPLNLTSQGNNSLEANNGVVSNVTDSQNVTVTEKHIVTLGAPSNKTCDVVTDKTPILGSMERVRPNDDVMVF
jgi:hypothetical protein